MRLVLASSSPRRRDLLRDAGIAVEVDPPQLDETKRPDETAEALALRLAREKAAAVAPRHPGDWVVAADTLVVQDGRVIGKPSDAEAAAQGLRTLSGRTHEVLTGVALQRDKHVESFVVRTEVDFRELSESEIARYVATGEPMDKAGGYGIQGGAAGFVREIRGSYTNVVGLPLAQILERIGVETISGL